MRTFSLVCQSAIKACALMTALAVLCCGCAAVAAPSAPSAAQSAPTSSVAQSEVAVSTSQSVPSSSLAQSAPAANGHLVVIDPGHQDHANTEQEPVGPGATQTKNKVSGGTVGTTTGLAEYELNLAVSLQLRDELERRGYTVLLTRETNDVNLSNVQRAQFAADAGADIFVRIHANGSTDASAHGAMTLCQTPQNPYNAQLYTASRLLAQCVLDGMLHATDAADCGVWETDTMAGINWSAVPVTLVEMGYMTNPQEDTLLADAGYQTKLVNGIADGIDAYFAAT